jgi:hypothetical protein
MNFIFMNKNTPLLECNIDMITGSILSITDVFNKSYLPLSIAYAPDNKDILKGYLHSWWKKRAIPLSRQKINEALFKIGIKDTASLLIKSLGLNLSDQYWMNPEGKLKWSDINFFENAFSNDIGNALFQEPFDRDNLNTMSPDNASIGWLKKRWRIVDNKRILVKGSSGPFHQEPLNEIIATAMMEHLKIRHIPYELEWKDGMPYSLCETFVTTDTELVPASDIMDSIEYMVDTPLYVHFQKACQKVGIKDMQTDINKMILLDCIIDNSDRHFNNFGFIRNVETLEWKGFAPLYDNGTSLWHNEITPGIKTNDYSATFLSSNFEQLELITDFSWFDKNKLRLDMDMYHDILQTSPYIDDNRQNHIIGTIGRNIGIVEFYASGSKT